MEMVPFRAWFSFYQRPSWEVCWAGKWQMAGASSQDSSVSSEFHLLFWVLFRFRFRVSLKHHSQDSKSKLVGVGEPVSS